jgi:hypothetical protein
MLAYDSGSQVLLMGAGASKDAGFPIVTDMADLGYVEEMVRVLREEHRPPLSKLTIPNFVYEVCAYLLESSSSFEEVLYEAVKQDKVELASKLLQHYHWVLSMSEPRSGNVVLYEDFEPPLAYGWGYLFMLALILKTRTANTTVITFNHDLLLEHGMFWEDFNYGAIMPRLISGTIIGKKAPRPLNGRSGKVTILKLHGSFNWCICKQCNSILCGTDYIWKFPHGYCWKCGGDALPWYVPPLREKDYSPVQEIWQDAAAALRTTERLIIAGYSFPDYDEHAMLLVQKNLNPEAEILIVDKFPIHTIGRVEQVRCRETCFHEMGFRDYILHHLSEEGQRFLEGYKRVIYSRDWH